MPRPRALIALAALLALAGESAAARPEASFAALGDGRFVMAMHVRPGTLVRFAQDQFEHTDRTAFILDVGGAGLLHDRVQDVVLLSIAYEGALTVVGFTANGDELYRVRDTYDTDAGIALLPGAGRFFFTYDSSIASHDTRTGEVVSEFVIAGHAQDVASANLLGADHLFVTCGGRADGAAWHLIALDWRTGAELWRQRDDAWSRFEPSEIAWDDGRLFTATSDRGVCTLTVRDRADGALLARTTLPANGAAILAPAGQPWLMVYRQTLEGCGSLTLHDRTTLAQLREVPLFEPRCPQVSAVHTVAPDRLLLDGWFMSCGDQQGESTLRHAVIDLAGELPSVRHLADRLAVDPAGRAWRLTWRDREVIGESPWVERTPIDLGAGAPSLPPVVARRFGDAVGGAAGGERTFHSNGPRSRVAGDAREFDRLLDECDACFLGVLDDVAFHCVERDGVAQARFRIDESYWGPTAEATVFIDRFDATGCIRFTETSRPRPEEFRPGGRYLVAARYREGVWMVEGDGLFPYVDDRLLATPRDAFTLPAPLDTIRARAARRDPRAQFDRADLVVEATIAGFDDDRDARVVATRVLAGEVACDCVSVAPLGEPGRERSWVHHGPRADRQGEEGYLLFLRELEPGRYELLEGRWSALRIDGPRLYRESGFAVPEARALLGSP